MAVIDSGSSTAGKANVNSTYDLQVALPDATTPSRVGGVRLFSENDTGTAMATNPWLQSPESDIDYRLRVSQDVFFEDEIFNYTAQNTGKYQYYNTTMTNAWAVSGMQTNSGSITTINTGTLFRSYAFFPIFNTSTTALDVNMAFSSAMVTNTTLDWGIGLNNTSTPYAPTDGVYFRLTSTGMVGVVNYNGTETTTSVFTFTPTVNKKYQYILYITRKECQFWINDGTGTNLYGRLATPVANGQPMCASAGQAFIRHAIGGTAASAGWSATLSNWNVRNGGANIIRTPWILGSSAYGSHQGLSGGTMGTLASYANSADPTAAANLSNTATLVTGLGGQFRFNAAATATTDGIVTSYQVPAGTVSIPGRRLAITGIKISSANLGAAVATTATTLAWSLAFGHTAVSMATAEAATTKAPRRVALGMQTWAVGAAIGQMPQNGDLYMAFNTPIYVNPGEFIATVAKFIVGTATASQVIWGHVTFDYGWE